MRAALERELLVRWYGKPGWLWLLWPLELVFRCVAFIRRARRAREVPPEPLVVVGNIAVGGAGKTPLVIALAQAATARGLRAGVISRGYGGQGPFPLLVDAKTPPALCGDEPALIARCASVLVAVDPDRLRALDMLRARGVDIVFSDDGLQHYRLPRTVEIVVIDAQRGLGNGHCLPVGPLREPSSRLATVDFVVGNGGDAWPGAAVMRFVPVAIRRLHDPGESMTLPAFVEHCGGAIDAVAGIGNPDRFFTTLRDAGLRVATHVFPDHHPYTEADFTRLAGRRLLMTAKDAVKCAALPGLENAWYLDIEARLPPGFVDAVFARALSGGIK